MKKLILACCLFAFASVHAQLNNQWIDYGKTYYKFRIGKNGLYRIPQNVLQANGLGSVPAQNFQLWHNGAEVALYTTQVSGSFGSTDFIEFYGVINDGKADKDLYRSPSYQLSDRVSLQTDSSTYFLTSSTNTNLRVTPAANNVAANILSAEPFLNYTEQYDFKEIVNRGYAETGSGEYIYSSSYDIGEMLSSVEIYSDTTPGYFAPNNYRRNFYPYTSGPNFFTAKVVAAGVALNNRDVRIGIGNTVIGTMNINGFDAKAQTFTNIPLGALTTGSNNYKINNRCPNRFDRIVIGLIDITYPRVFRFDNRRNFEFELAPNVAGQYLEITDFDRGTALPLLYNRANNRRYVADVSGSGVIRFALPPSTTTTQYVLLSQDAGHIFTINSLQPRSFTNYANTSNQADYLIISNPFLFTPVNGVNAVEAYRQYRSTAVGGGFNTKIYDVDQLEDQFAFGIKKHPSSIRNFLRYARLQFSVQPKFSFLIGKGVSYQDYRFSDALATNFGDRLNLVTTFGYPASDGLLASADINPYPTTPIGRLNVINGQEIIDYLEKVKQYEAAQGTTSNKQIDVAWKKNVVHVVGANDAGLAGLLGFYMDNYKFTVEDTLFGAKVTTLNKFNSGTATAIDNQTISKLFTDGHSLLTYFGHSSATALDYNLEDPNNYSNPGKYPMFLLNGCNAGNFYTLDTFRLQLKTSISEKFVLAPNGGSIGMIASTSFGLTGGLNAFTTGFYRSVTSQSYGQSIGKNMQDAAQYISNALGFNSYDGRIHAEQQTLHGDPAIKINNFAKPDFSVEIPNIVINPTFISVAESQFKVKVYHYNLGRAKNDSITIEVKRQYPVSQINANGATEIVYSKKIRSPHFIDSFEISLPIIATRDKGTNKITVTLDTENKVDELSETNNTASQDVVIFEDEMRPVFPYNFSIVSRQNIKLVGSTSTPFSTTQKQYRMELDTTELFHSAAKVTKNASVAGGIIEFDPGIVYKDSTVYYWRLGVVPASGTPLRWNTFSFVYLPNSLAGFNQSHLFQHTKSSVQRIFIDSTTRKWQFTSRQNNLFFTQSVFPISGDEDVHFNISVNNEAKIQSACVGHSLIFSVFDPVTFKLWANPTGGAFGSASNTCFPGRGFNYEFDDRDTGNRRKIIAFMDAIPNGYYVAVRKFLDEPYNLETFANTLKSDEQYFGTGNSVYHRLKAQGFAEIDSFNRPRIWVLAYKKNDPNFATKWRFSDGLERIQLNVYCPTPDTLGFINSPVFGPAKAWKQVKWRGNSQDATAADLPTVQVIGINNSGAETQLFNLSPTQQDFDISLVSPTQYPFIRLRMRNVDSIFGTAYNLQYWRLLYDPVPEGALAANLFLRNKDSLELGEPLDFAIAFKNISDTKFRDSIKVKAIIVDQANVPHIIPISKRKDLLPGDTTNINVKLDTKDYPGVNNLFIELNGDDDQPEQYHFNNFLYRDLFVRPDNYNPLLDVTFDGQHILNRDIVSTKPHIVIKLKDEATFLLLNDTSLLRLTLRYPDGNFRTYKTGTDTLRFTPAINSNDNTATLDFYPTLNQDSEQRDYELTVTGKDRTGNKAGPTEYRISFQVYNKPAITNLFNYPNPFTTSTAFVFTITGKEIPQEFKIQILTITGKIVREITKQELGTLNIGRNITEYKWDGTDQYGGKLANGVYLYRVVTGLNGSKLDKFRINDGFNQQALDETDKYFNKGYGKMYLLR